MVNAVILLCLCLWRLFDVTDEVKTISVMEGDPVTLHADANKIQKYLLIQWMFGHTRIAEVNRLAQINSTYDGPDERFRGRLQLDQTGSLTITNTSTTDSGLYKVTVFSSETSYKSFNVMVSETPQCSATPESSSFVSSNQTENVNISELHQSSSDHFHCCGCTETVIRLVVSALVSMAAVAFLVYDIRSTRNELNRTDETSHHHPTRGVNADQHQLSRRNSSRYVC
ncbi:uncharacterized protein LOC132160325 [Carassius carassius]|uniref:uncharacterized protein LOC132160325 n=1 Tax=Carassius carassius TaxID=217509 RepID=UPI002868C08E|nr:uncharacterized protein LOC132160325 [Carassius carassius]